MVLSESCGRAFAVALCCCSIGSYGLRTMVFETSLRRVWRLLIPFASQRFGSVLLKMIETEIDYKHAIDEKELVRSYFSLILDTASTMKCFCEY